jgi:hypothetical protein
MLACRERLEAAGDIKKTDEVNTLLKEINDHFALVQMTFDPKYAGMRILIPQVPPFAPDSKEAIRYVNAQLMELDVFTCLLPVGDYTLGGGGFTVFAGGYTRLQIDGEVEEQEKVARAPREPRKKRQKKDRRDWNVRPFGAE